MTTYHDDIDHLVEKGKGRLEQVRGEIKKSRGDTIGGTLDKIKGNTRETIADIKNDINHDKDSP